MPEKLAVDESDLTESESELEAPAPKEQAAPKRKRAKVVCSSKLELGGEEHLRVLVGRQCKCRKQDCFSQFLETEAFQKLKDYKRYWHDLHKLDQDQFAFRLLSVLFLHHLCWFSFGEARNYFCFFFRDHRHFVKTPAIKGF